MTEMSVESLEDILFLSYLTRYNISEIYKILQYQEHSYFETEYAADNKNNVTPKTIEEAKKAASIAIEKLKYHNIEPILFTSSKYPTSLRRLKDYPPILYVRGDLKNIGFAAIVGSRKASRLAEKKVADIVKVFLGTGYGIASGLALGIDSFAHQATLDQQGYTVAVMPTSLDTIYPLENFGLANKILDKGGALISELPLGINRGKMSFIERNRLQTGLSTYVVPVEMGTNSGTMHTVNFCIQQKKTLLLPVPDPSCLNKYQTYYEGIMFLIDKYKDNRVSNVISFQNDAELKSIISSPKSNLQGELF